MRLRMPSAVLSAAAAGLVLCFHSGGANSQPALATGPEAGVTEEGLHRVDPLIMEGAWVRPDVDFSRYTRILLMPTAVHFRDVPQRRYDPRTSIGTTEFPLSNERKEWLRREWRRAVEAVFAEQSSYELYEGAGEDVLVVQAFLVDVVSRIPPDVAGSAYTMVRDPWIVHVVLELRDGATAELLARSVDQRRAEGLLEVGEVWHQTRDVVERWAESAYARLTRLSDLFGGQGRNAPSWAR